MAFFWLVLGILVLQRIGELFLAARNARIIRSRGGYEIGADHYIYFVVLHMLFFLSLILEVTMSRVPDSLPGWWPLFFAVAVSAQLLRYWCIWSLGSRWNTRILVLPGAPPVRRGPYRYIRHPNYLVVATELFAVPMTFGATMTALAFTILNAWLLLCVRIPLEERAVYETKE